MLPGRLGLRWVPFAPMRFAVSPPLAFHRNWSVSAVLESATWSSSSVFSSFYLHDIQHEYDGIRSLGPFVAAGSRNE